MDKRPIEDITAMLDRLDRHWWSFPVFRNVSGQNFNDVVFIKNGKPATGMFFDPHSYYVHSFAGGMWVSSTYRALLEGYGD